MTMPDYSDVIDMLFTGFITSPAEIGGVPVVFKTLNQKEYEQSVLYSYSSDPNEERELKQCYFIANSVYLFNRTSVLSDRETFLAEFVEVLLDLPAGAREEILGNLQRINRRALEAIDQVEAFSYGYDSRQRWSLIKNMSPNDPRVTGIQGSEFLGLNMHQRLWFHYNRRDDTKDAYELDWNRSKFEASVHSKEIGKLDSKDREARREEHARREAIFLGQTPEDATVGSHGELRVSHETADELLGQIKRTVEGQVDFHDQVVLDHERRVRENYKRRQAETARKAQEARETRAQFESQDLKDPVIFYDEDTLKAMEAVKKTERRQALKDGHYAGAEEEDKAERMRKWGILDEKDPPQPKNEHPLSGTLMDNYYDVQMPDMSGNFPFDDE